MFVLFHVVKLRVDLLGREKLGGGEILLEMLLKQKGDYKKYGKEEGFVLDEVELELEIL